MDCSRRLLCLWDFPGKNTGVGGHFLFQGIFLPHGSNPGFPHWRQTLYHWAIRKAPYNVLTTKNWVSIHHHTLKTPYPFHPLQLLLLGNHYSVLCIYVFLSFFFFFGFFIYPLVFFFIPYISEIIWYLSFSIWLSSLIIISPTSIHVVENGKILSFYMAL